MAKENNLLMWVVIGLLAFMVFQNNQAPVTPPGDNGDGGDDGGLTIITGSTALTVVAADKLQPGTAVTPTTQIAIDGSAYAAGVATASPGQVLSVLLNKTTAAPVYHRVYLPALTVPSSPTMIIKASFYANSTATIKLFNEDSDVMGDQGTTRNYTVAGAGISANMKVEFQGADKQSTNDMRCILETNETTAVQEIVLSGLGAVKVTGGKPSFYTSSFPTNVGTGNPQQWIYDIEPVEGNVLKQGSIQITPKTSQSLASTYFKFACYTKEHFIDSVTGQVEYAIEDSAGTQQSLALYRFEGFIN